MSERGPSGEQSERDTSFKYRLNRQMKSDLDEAAQKLGISVSQVILNAADFEICRRAVRAGGMVLEARHPNGVDVESVHAVTTEFKRPESKTEAEPFRVTYTQKEMQTIMLLASYGYDEEIGENAEGFYTWDEQRTSIGQTTAAALRTYFARLEAERQGWTFFINPNLGDEMNDYLSPHGRSNEANDDST